MGVHLAALDALLASFSAVEERVSGLLPPEAGVPDGPGNPDQNPGLLGGPDEEDEAVYAAVRGSVFGVPEGREGGVEQIGCGSAAAPASDPDAADGPESKGAPDQAPGGAGLDSLEAALLEALTAAPAVIRGGAPTATNTNPNPELAHPSDASSAERGTAAGGTGPDSVLHPKVLGNLAGAAKSGVVPASVDIEVAAVASPVVMPVSGGIDDGGENPGRLTGAPEATGAKSGPAAADAPASRSRSRSPAKAGGAQPDPPNPTPAAGGSAGRSSVLQDMLASIWGEPSQPDAAPANNGAAAAAAAAFDRAMRGPAPKVPGPSSAAPAAVPPASAAELARWGLARVDFSDDEDDEEDDLYCACGKVHPPTWRHSLADPTGPPLPPLGPAAGTTGASAGAGPSSGGAAAMAGPLGRPAAAGDPAGGPSPAGPDLLDGLIAEADARVKVQATGSYEGSLRGTGSGEAGLETPPGSVASAPNAQGEAAVLPAGAGHRSYTALEVGVAACWQPGGAGNACCDGCCEQGLSVADMQSSACLQTAEALKAI